MLTRLRVSGFKNLIDIDVRFGPFTCIAGANGVGKSNLFDAIRFLSDLADRPLMDAALSVRDESGKTSDIRSLFYRQGDDIQSEMSFEAEMIIPSEGTDDLGQKAKATTTFLRYSVSLVYRKDENVGSLSPLQLRKEELVHITQAEASRHLLFPHKYVWRRSAVKGRRAGKEFISTDPTDGIIKLHQDGGGGRPLSRPATDLPRTVLSVTNAAESPTALLTRREMQSWRLLQLEPSALRKPDEFLSPPKLGSDGSHLPATLFRLAHPKNPRKSNGEENGAEEKKVYSQIANRLSELIDDVRDLNVDRDERRELYTLYVTGKDRTSHAARALSDGTLRFLALSVLVQDPESQGVLCLEEPENGIHPERIPAMIQLLQEIAVDADEPVGFDNPLRQVIVNTHSPSVVQQVPEDSLLVAEIKEIVKSGKRLRGVSFGCLPSTWRERNLPGEEAVSICPKGTLLAYLNPVMQKGKTVQTKKSQRVVDRNDLRQLMLPWPGEKE